MNSLLYYEVCFFISVILTLIYVYLWHDGMDVYTTCLFVLLPIVNLGCIWLYVAPTPEISIIANKVVYLAGCYWPFLATKAILAQCHINIKKIYTVIGFIVCNIFYGFALTSDYPGALYKSISFVEVNGRYEMYPEYGWMHTVIYAVMILYVIVGTICLIYAMKNVVRASQTNLRMIFLGEVITIVVFFIYGVKNLAGSPAILYVCSQLVLLIAGYRSYYYDIDASVMDTILVDGKLGYITFNMRKRLLGCNQVAENYFPELCSVRTDRPLDNRDGIKATISECLDQIEQDHQPLLRIIPCGDRFISLKADFYQAHGKKNIYRIIMEDDTDHQNLVAILNREKDTAVQEKQLVTDTFHRYVDPKIADTLLSSSSEEMDSGVEKKLSVLFADIRGFTSFSESKDPREVLKVLNLIMEIATSCVMANHGIVDKIIGDCVMAVWDEPDDPARSVYNACMAACSIQNAMKELHPKLMKEYGADLHMGIGVNFGTAIVGNVGTELRSDFTAIGDAVNIASRLESIAGAGEILVTSDVSTALGDKASFSPAYNNITLKGRSRETLILKLNELK